MGVKQNHRQNRDPMDKLIRSEFARQVRAAGGSGTPEMAAHRSSGGNIREVLTSLAAAAALLSAGVMFEIHAPSQLQRITGEVEYQMEIRSRLIEVGGRIESVLIESMERKPNSID